jgi:hypothetical protein
MIVQLLDMYVGGIFNAALGMGVILASCLIIGDYINAKRQQKELEAQLRECRDALDRFYQPAGPDPNEREPIADKEGQL